MNSIAVSTTEKVQFVDITDDVEEVVLKSGIVDGICTVYVPHATAAITINENADPNLPLDIIKVLGKLVPEHDGYGHDRIDNNAAAHIKAAILGPSESIPISDGKLALGTWQDIFLCEFDGPRNRTVHVEVTNK